MGTYEAKEVMHERQDDHACRVDGPGPLMHELRDDHACKIDGPGPLEHLHADGYSVVAEYLPFTEVCSALGTTSSVCDELEATLRSRRDIYSCKSALVTREFSLSI